MKPVTNDDYDENPDDPLEHDDVENDDIDDGNDVDVADIEVDADGEKVISEAARKKADEVAEAESLTVTAKNGQRQQLEDELARFLAQGGRIVEVPPDDNAHD
jgi:hypothetical protein